MHTKTHKFTHKRPYIKAVPNRTVPHNQLQVLQNCSNSQSSAKTLTHSKRKLPPDRHHTKSILQTRNITSNQTQDGFSSCRYELLAHGDLYCGRATDGRTNGLSARHVNCSKERTFRLQFLNIYTPN